MFSNKFLLAVAVTVGVAMPLSACGGSDDPKAGTSTGKATASPAVTSTLTAQQAKVVGAKAGDPVVEVDGSPEATVSAGDTTDEPTPTTTPSPQAAEQLSADVAGDAGLEAAGTGETAGTDAEDYPDYRVFTYSTGAFSYEAPAAWNDRRENVATGGDNSVLSADFDGWAYSKAPGVQLTRLNAAAGEPEQILAGERDRYYGGACGGPGKVRPYADGRFTGSVETYTGCPNGGTTAVMAVKSVGTSPARFRIAVTMLQSRDAAALGRIVSSLTYTG